VGADDGFDRWDRFPEGQHLDDHSVEFLAILMVLAFGVLFGAALVGLAWWLT
jgi:hypothetical protein